MGKLFYVPLPGSVKKSKKARDREKIDILTDVNVSNKKVIAQYFKFTHNAF